MRRPRRPRKRTDLRHSEAFSCGSVIARPPRCGRKKPKNGNSTAPLCPGRTIPPGGGALFVVLRLQASRGGAALCSGAGRRLSVFFARGLTAALPVPLRSAPPASCTLLQMQPGIRDAGAQSRRLSLREGNAGGRGALPAVHRCAGPLRVRTFAAACRKIFCLFGKHSGRAGKQHRQHSGRQQQAEPLFSSCLSSDSFSPPNSFPFIQTL